MAKIELLLKDEKILTKSELSSYKKDKFYELDKYIKHLSKTDNDNLLSVKEICDQRLTQNSESIIALYISGSIGMIRRPYDENINMINLIITFYDVHNWECVEFLSEKVLALNENRRVLRMLADCYEETGRTDMKWAIYERLVKVDIDEKKIIKQLAAHFQSLGNNEKAIFYYKRSLLRFLNISDGENSYSCYKELLKLTPDDFGYFLGMADKAYSVMGKEIANLFLQDLLSLNTEEIDNTILVLKKQLEFDPTLTEAKVQLITAYKTKYGKSKRFNYCMKQSGLDGNKVDVNKAIVNFETDIAFDIDSFVYQRSTDRVGKIVAINEKEVTTLFDQVGKKTMSFNMARRALEPIPKTNIKVLKLAPLDKLKTKFTSDINWALKTLINSHNNKCSIKDMKADLCPSILDAKEWQSFLRDAKTELMENPYFSNIPGETDTYMLRTTPITTEEKLLIRFKMETDFYKKIQIVRDFIKAEGDIESESFMEMIKFFNDELRKINREKVLDTVLSAYLLLDYLISHEKIATVHLDCNYTFLDLYKKLGGIEEKVNLFKNITIPELKKSFIDEIIENDKAWPQILKLLFPYYTYAYIPESLKSNGQYKVFIEIIKESVENYKDNADVFLWLVNNAEKDDLQKAGIDDERLIITQLLLLDFTAQCIENKSNVTENKKRNLQLLQSLFTEKSIFDALEKGSLETAQNFYSLIANNRALDPGKVIEIKHMISERFPDFKFFDKTSSPDVSAFIPTGFLCTKAAFDKKKAELEHIQHVELPLVAEEIADARALGDLRENSEYQYGKEKQKNLNAMLKTLSDEIEKAQIISSSTVNTSKVSFGTEVTLLNKLTGHNISYKILGQWESNPDENIINFKTPLGTNLLNKVIDEEFDFTINGQKHSYKVLGIKALKF